MPNTPFDRRPCVRPPRQVTGDTPQLRPNGVKVHAVVNKLLAGHYVASVVDGRWTPVLESMERKKRTDYDSTAQYKVREPRTAASLAHAGF